MERIAQAVSEVKKAARTDPISGAEGAIVLLGRVSPALEHVDSSSGAIGSAVNSAIDALVPIIRDAPAGGAVRRMWLERLWKAFVADQIPYIERLGDYWGDLCATPEIAAEWARRLLPPVLESFARDGRCGGSYFHGTMACFSAMSAAGQFQEILNVIDRAPHVWWRYRRWGFRALVEQGKRAEALRYAEASRDSTHNYDKEIAQACEQLLLKSGFAEDAYNRYAIAAASYEPTYLARFRSLAKKYPWKRSSDLLRDLVGSTPGNEGKWFAAAKSAGLYEEAAALAEASPCDPKTLTRAARDFKDKRPLFAVECAIAALHWFSEGYGYEITSLDVIEPYRHGLAAAVNLDRVQEFNARARAAVANGKAFVRDSLRPLLDAV